VKSLIQVEKRVHKVWEECNIARSKGIELAPIIGKYQYIYSSEKGKISLIELLHYFYVDQSTLWEIYCQEGNLFDDVERFTTKEEAETRIKELLITAKKTKPLLMI